MKQKTMRQSSALKKTRVNQLFSLILLSFGAFMCSCSERIHVIPVDDGPGIPVNVRVASVEQVPFGSQTKSSALNEVCSRITFSTAERVRNPTRSRKTRPWRARTSGRWISCWRRGPIPWWCWRITVTAIPL